MTADEFDIRQTARDLKKLYAALDALKHAPATPPEVRTMRPAPGPQSPGNWLWMSRAVDMEQKLREIAFNAFSDIHVKLRDGDAKVNNLLELVALHAHAISELPWGQDFLDELEDQARTIGKWVNPPEPKEVDQRPERYVDIETIVRNLNQRGHMVTPRQAREVAVYNKFDVCKFHDTRNGYKLMDFLRHYEKREA